MNAPDDRSVELEAQARVLLAESVTRIDGRIRSRLNEARQAAVAESLRKRRRPAFLHGFLLVPTAGAVAAAVLVAMVLWPHQPQGGLPVSDGGQVMAQDLDLIADGEGLDMVEESDGAFYEWAAAQADVGNSETSS